MRHSTLAGPDQLHKPFAWVVADATERNALAITASHIGHVAIQLDDNSIWRLSAVSPDALWNQIGAGAAAIAAAIASHNADANAHGGLNALAPQTIIKAKLKAPMVYPLHGIQQTDHLTFSGLVATLQASGSDPFAAVFGNGTGNAISEIVANLTVTLPAVAGTYWLYVERNPVTGALTLGATDVAPEYGQARRGVDAMPAHTTHVGAFGTVSASSEYSASYAAWKAFNRVNVADGDAWLTSNGTVTGWLRCAQTKPRALIGYQVVCSAAQTATSAPKTWTLKTGSGSTPDTVADTQTNAPSFTQGELRTYWLATPIACASLEINITANQGNASYTAIGELIPLFTDDFYHIPQNTMYKADGTAVQRVYVGFAVSNGTSITRVAPFALGKNCVVPINGGNQLSAGTPYITDNSYGAPAKFLVQFFAPATGHWVDETPYDNTGSIGRGILGKYIGQMYFQFRTSENAGFDDSAVGNMVGLSGTKWRAKIEREF